MKGGYPGTPHAHSARESNTRGAAGSGIQTRSNRRNPWPVNQIEILKKLVTV
jgi:hypothetical protein